MKYFYLLCLIMAAPRLIELGIRYVRWCLRKPTPGRCHVCGCKVPNAGTICSDCEIEVAAAP